jgi:ATP-binding protein involved in chromosome partitioning
VTVRGYFDLREPDRSGLLAQVEAHAERVARRLEEVARVVAVTSGKGGVGKSYVTAATASAAARQGLAVGVVDADLKSPTVARLLDAQGPLRLDGSGVRPATGRHGVRVVSTDFLLDDGRPVIWREPDSARFVWRGALETGVLREFLGDVAWGALDLLLVDLPPGADAVLDLAELAPRLTGAVAVTLPSEESARSVERTIRAALERGIAVLGVVENMSGYRCAGCGETRPLFAGDGGARLARTCAVPLLGRVPFDLDGARIGEPPWAQIVARVLGIG